MAYNKSKAKGSAFEAKIAASLTIDFGKQFRRVPLSGALEWMKGDIMCIVDTAWFPWCIECKHYKEINFNSLLTAKSADMYSFWEQTQREALVMEKKPLLIFRWDRSKDFVAYDDDIIVESFMEVNSFGHKFKIALLTDWVKAVKSQTDLANHS
jgi:hypothetical protein